MRFRTKFILMISLIVTLTFLILDISLLLLYNLIVANQPITNSYDINSFNEFASSQILHTNINYIQTGIDIFDNVLVQIYETHKIFHNNKSLYN